MGKVDEDKIDKSLKETLDKLQSENQALTLEIEELNALMKKVGFHEGLASLKATALEFQAETVSKKQLEIE